MQQGEPVSDHMELDMPHNREAETKLKKHSHIRITIPPALIRRKRGRIPKEWRRQVVASFHFVDAVGTVARAVGSRADEDAADSTSCL